MMSVHGDQMYAGTKGYSGGVTVAMAMAMMTTTAMVTPGTGATAAVGRVSPPRSSGSGLSSLRGRAWPWRPPPSGHCSSP